MNAPIHERDALARMVLGVMEIGQIVNRSHRRTRKRHQDKVRSVQHMAVEVSGSPAEQLAAGEAVQVQGDGFERYAVPNFAQSLVEAQGLIGVGKPTVSREETNVINRRASASHGPVAKRTDQYRSEAIE